MPEDLRAYQRHVTMGSLKATHEAHGVAMDVYSTPTEALNEINPPTAKLAPGKMDYYAMVAARWEQQPKAHPTPLWLKRTAIILWMIIVGTCLAIISLSVGGAIK